MDKVIHSRASLAAAAVKAKSDEWDFRGSLSGMRPRNLSDRECREIVDLVLNSAALSGLSLPGRDDDCPHCGASGYPDIVNEKTDDKVHPYRVRCAKCGCSTAHHGDWSEARKAWCRRPALSPPISGDSSKGVTLPADPWERLEVIRSGIWAAAAEGLTFGPQTMIAEAIGAVLNIPADGWQTIDSAPKDGRQLTLIDMSAAASEAGSGYFWDGVWSCVEPNSQVPASAICWQSPTHWRNPAAPPITPEPGK